MTSRYLFRKAAGQAAAFPISSARGLFKGLFSLIIIAALLPLRTEIGIIPLYTPYVPFLGLTVLAFMTWCLRPYILSLRREEWAFIIAQLLIVVVSALSIWPSDAIGNSLYAIYSMGLYLGVRFCLRRGLLLVDDLRSLAASAFWLLTVIVLLEISFHNNFGNIGNYFGTNRSETYFYHGILRVSGTFNSPNVFAKVYTTYGVILIIWNLFRADGTNARRAVILSLLITLVDVFTLSRSGMLYAVLVQTAIYVYWGSRKSGRFNLAIGVGLPIVAIAVTGILIWLIFSAPAEVNALTRSSSEGRLNVIIAAVELLKHWSVALHGAGSGEFFMAIAHYGIPLQYETWHSLIDIHASVHNWPLQMATEAGLPVLMVYSYAIYKTTYRGWQLRRRKEARRVTGLAITIAALYLGALEFGTSGTTPWVLTPVVIILATIQHEFSRLRRCQFEDSGGDKVTDH